jgi:SAM-dependent methyltransferase
MTERTDHDNQALLAFWDQAFAIPEGAKEADRKEGPGSWEELAPSEKLLRAVCALDNRKKVLDFGCGNGWAAIAAAKSGCPEVTAADPAPNAVDAAAFYAELFGVRERIRPICGGSDWLKTVPAETFDGLICSNVLDVVPPETAEALLRELERVLVPGARAVVGLNYYLSPEAAAEKGVELAEGRSLYQDGVLRLVSRTDEEWAALFAPRFTVESLEHFAWPGESEERRRLFRLRRRQRAETGE